MRTLLVISVALLLGGGCARESMSSLPSASSMRNCQDVQDAIAEASGKAMKIMRLVEEGDMSVEDAEAERQVSAKWSYEVRQRAYELGCQ